MERIVMVNNNIVEVVQADLGYPPLEKINPNTQETKAGTAKSREENIAQAAIPAVLAGFFNFTRSLKGCNYILAGGRQQNWLDTIFGDKKELAVEKIAQYTGLSLEEASINMEDIAREAVIIIHEGPGENPSAEKIKSYMSSQRHHILVYLLPALQLGELLNDNAMDDQTNKMEGPISTLMHNIENKLSGGGS